MPVSEQTYLCVAKESPEGQWELDGGRLREKPPMTWHHGDSISELSYMLRHQLDRNEFRVHINHSRFRRSADHYYIPDVAVIPLAYGCDLRGRSDRLEIYTDPLPLVVEVWSPSTSGYDVDAKLPEYQKRGDQEIWRLHPYDRTLIAWRRQPDGTYVETVYRGGIVRPVALPNVEIDLDVLFDS